MRMSVLLVCLPMHWALNHLELELKTIVSLHVGVGNVYSLDEQPVFTAEPSLLSSLHLLKEVQHGFQRSVFFLYCILRNRNIPQNMYEY